ncbi:3-hydroxyacyl-CoA dehydrogenase NAD-binding domain-containing protein [bacterium]|nr:3-hydroxyacyl-CoA dehydrogenase NAD-binding domain-containing protein [bacterium]
MAEVDSQAPKAKASRETREGTAFTFVERERGIANLIFDAQDQKVNILTSNVMLELDTILDELHERQDIAALIMLSGKEDNFIAGADVSEIRDITDPDEGAQKARQGQRIFQKIHDLPFPVIAAIQGACVGGGLELALACHFRIAKTHPKTRIGLPEVRLGILPGFGGTQRLPRLIGIQRALKLILTGKLVNAKMACRMGIVDKVLPIDYPFSFMKAAAEEFAYHMRQNFLRSAYEKKRNAKRLHAIFLESNKFGRKFLFEQARKQTLKTTAGHYPAPLKALEAVRRGVNLPIQQGLEIEAKLLGELIATKVSKNLISIYYLNEDLKKDAGVEKTKHEPAEIESAGLLGAGIMGGGIAQLLAFHELPVRMKDINQEALDIGLNKAQEVFQKAVLKRKLTRREMRRRMSLIAGTTDYSGFGNVDLVIEAIVENLEMKKVVFGEIAEKVREDTILVSNTSSLSIGEMSADLPKPERFVGLHFFNPVHRMPLVEVIRSEKTSDQTVVSVVAFSKRLGKIPIVVKDSPGFLVNRILGPYLNEATRMLEEGATIEQIDQAMVAFGMPMGPLNLLDEVGIDVANKVSKILQAAFDGRVQPSKVVERLHANGRLGKKGGKGFYVYDGRRKKADAAVYDLIVDLRSSNTKLTDEQIQSRLVFIMLKEAVLCLQEEVVRRARDVDAGMIFGTGFPPFRGGLLKHADNVGVQKCVEKMEELRDGFGEQFEVPRLLHEFVQRGHGFYGKQSSQR